MLVLADVAKVEVQSMEGTVLRAPRMGEAGKPLKLHNQTSPQLPSLLLYISSLAHKQDLLWATAREPCPVLHGFGLAPSCVATWISYNCNTLKLLRE